MQTYSAFFKTLHDETSPTGHLGRGTHYSILRAIVFHDPMGRALSRGKFADFAVIWDEDHDVRVVEAIEQIYRQGLLSSFVMFGERKGSFTAIVANEIEAATKSLPFSSALLCRVGDLEFSDRTVRCLECENVLYAGDLVQKQGAELLQLPNFGKKSLGEIEAALARLDLHLGMEVPAWPPANVEELMLDHARIESLPMRIKAICESLDDPWNSKVAALESPQNPIILDEVEKVHLYVKNLEMLWQLGIKIG